MSHTNSSRKPSRIFPSILSADFACLGEEAKAAILAGADGIHFDVMDNHYVPNLTIGAVGCRALRDYGITAPIDVHLMASPVDRLITDFAKSGASAITIHPEATTDLDESLDLIKQQGCLAGVALNPATSIDCIKPVIDKLDQILVMSVNPGFGGQDFIEATLDKMRTLSRYLDERGRQASIVVDGGVKVENIALIKRAGADTFILGSAFFYSKNYVETVKMLRDQLT